MHIYAPTKDQLEFFSSLKDIVVDLSTLEPLLTTPLCGELHPHFGCKHSEETKLLMSIKKRGKLNPNANGITESHKQNIRNAVRGRVYSDEIKQRFHEAQSKPEQRKILSDKMKEHLSDPLNYETRKEQIIRLNKDPINRQNKGKKMSGKRWYNNGKKNIRIEPDLLPEGFVLGKLKFTLNM